ncbi:MAG TPA: cytochrome c oxidase assembly protein [Gemmatimonadales bacterium]
MKRRASLWCAAGGLAVLLVALAPPLHELSERSFAAHMLQHELLMLVAAPLLVLAHPLWQVARLLPPSVVRALPRPAPSLRLAWRRASSPFGGFMIHAVTLWGWHHPALFEAALHNDAVHILQHASFLGGALVFWHSLLRRRAHRDAGLGVLSLFATTLHTGALGALLTMAPRLWYPSYALMGGGAAHALEDQQLGGLIMWIPASLVYVGFSLTMFARWLDESGRRTAGAGVPDAVDA